VKKSNKFKGIKTVAVLLCVFFGLSLFSYLFLCFILPAIPVAREKTKEDRLVTVYLFKGGVHTDFLVPVVTRIEDWSSHFPYANNRIVDTTFRWIRIGFGDKAFFTQCPTWGDLTFSMAIKAMTGGNGAAIHAYYEYEIPMDKPTARLSLTLNQYERLCTYIKNSLVFRDGKPILLSSLEGTTFDYDRYYAAYGTYSLASTCNTWINDGLKASGQKACYWSALAGGLFYQYGR